MASVLLGMVQQAPILGLVLILSHNHTGSNFFEPGVSQTNWKDILELLFNEKGHPWIFFSELLVLESQRKSTWLATLFRLTADLGF